MFLKNQKHGNEQADRDQRGWGGGEGMRGDRRGPCTKDPWTRTMGRRMSLGVEVGQGRGEQWEKWGQL